MNEKTPASCQTTIISRFYSCLALQFNLKKNERSKISKVQLETSRFNR